MSRCAWAGLGAAVMLVGVAGCGGGSPQSTPGAAPAPAPGTGLPARPATLRIEGIDPCTLLTPAQQAKLGVEQGIRNDFKPDNALSGTSCFWRHNDRPRYGYLPSLLLNRGAEFALGTEPLRTVGGYAATTTGSALSDPQWDCIMLVDVGPGQSLLSEYHNYTEDIPGMTHEKACDNAQAAAAMMLGNLRAAQPGGR